MVIFAGMMVDYWDNSKKGETPANHTAATVMSQSLDQFFFEGFKDLPRQNQDHILNVIEHLYFQK
jgi:hypothetical protein